MDIQAIEFPSPLLNAAGSLGFAPDLRAVQGMQELGAFFTNPVSLRPRRQRPDSADPRQANTLLIEQPGPNPGLSRVIHRYSGKWARSPLPIDVPLQPGFRSVLRAY